MIGPKSEEEIRFFFCVFEIRAQNTTNNGPRAGQYEKMFESCYCFTTAKCRFCLMRGGCVGDITSLLLPHPESVSC